jgi:hypothetical protein
MNWTISIFIPFIDISTKSFEGIQSLGLTNEIPTLVICIFQSLY